MTKVILGDELMDRNKASVDIEDRGYQFGDGVYEVVRIYDGRLFTFQEHIDRFFRSAEKIKLQVPFTKEKMKELVLSLVEEEAVVDGTVYMQLTRGAAKRGHMFPAPESCQAVFSAYTNQVDRPEDFLQKGFKAITAEDIRWLRCDIKSLNLLPNVLAKQEAVEAGCQEAILYRGETVTEGSSSNIYLVRDGEILTHPADNLILNGITRNVVQKICSGNGIPFHEQAFRLQDIGNADELFLTSTTSEVMPIVEVDGEPVGDGTPGKVTRRLQHFFKEKISVPNSTH